MVPNTFCKLCVSVFFSWEKKLREETREKKLERKTLENKEKSNRNREGRNEREEMREKKREGRNEGQLSKTPLFSAPFSREWRI